MVLSEDGHWHQLDEVNGNPQFRERRRRELLRCGPPCPTPSPSWSRDRCLGENTVTPLQRKGHRPSQSLREAGLCSEQSPPLVRDWFLLMQMKAPNLYRWIGPKGTVLIGQNGPAVIAG